MDAPVGTFPQSRRERGSTLLLTLIVGMALTSIIIYSTNDTADFRRNQQREDNYAKALSAAEYGAELAIRNIVNGISLEEGSAKNQPSAVVNSDWVQGQKANSGDKDVGIYASGGTTGEQRRIRGQYDDQEFRVRVRSARLAYENDLVGDGKPLNPGWLSKPESFTMGADKLKNYRDTYEITSTAMNAQMVNRSGGANAELAARPVIQAVVNIEYESPKNYFDSLQRGVVDFASYPNAGLNADLAAEITGAVNEKYNWPAAHYRSIANYQADNPQYREAVYNLTVSGEDHYINKFTVNDIVSQRITTPLKLVATDANFTMGLEKGYFGRGRLTLNFVHKDNVETGANPYRPRTDGDGGEDWQRSMLVGDTLRTYDEYLLGGKLSGKTVTVESTRTDGDGNTIPAIHEGVTGLIVETESSQFRDVSKFNIVLGAFEDLRNIYINVAGVDAPKHENDGHETGNYADTNLWYQMFVGQYTFTEKEARHPDLHSSNVSYIHMTAPSYGGKRIRPQTLHLLNNEKDEILVRLYSREEYEESGIPVDAPAGGSETEEWVEEKWVGKEWVGETWVDQPYVTQFTGTPTWTSADSYQKNGKTFKYEGYYDSRWGGKKIFIVTGSDRTGTYDLDRYWCTDYGINLQVAPWYIQFSIAAQLPNNILLMNTDDAARKYGNYIGTPNGMDKSEFDAWVVAETAAEQERAKNWVTDQAKRKQEFEEDQARKKQEFEKEQARQKQEFEEEQARKKKEWEDELARQKEELANLPRTTRYYKHPVKYGKWTGYYVWAAAKMEPEGRLRLTEESPWSDTTLSYERNSVARAMHWQELVGYQLKRRYEVDKSLSSPNEPAVMSAKVDGKDKRTMFRVDENGEYIPAGFDEIYQAYFDCAEEKHPLMEKYGNAVSEGYLDDRFDTIYVIEGKNAEKIFKKVDGKLDSAYDADLAAIATAHTDLNSFRFDKDFRQEGSDSPYPLKAVKLLIGFEDMVEYAIAWGGADYNYTDLMFALYIAPQETLSSKDVTVLGKSSQQWWERDEVEGLTGALSHHAVTANNLAGDSENMLADNFKRLNFKDNSTYIGTDATLTLEHNLWTMLDRATRTFTEFPRAVFQKDHPDLVEMNVDKLPDHLAAYVKERKESGKPYHFHFTRDDVVLSLQTFFSDAENQESFTNSEEYIAGETQRIITLNASGGGNANVYLHYIDERWDDECGDANWANRNWQKPPVDRAVAVKRTADPDGSYSLKAGGAFNVPDTNISARELAGLLVGFQAVNVPVIETDNYSPVSSTDDAPKAKYMTLGFLAGEMLPLPADDKYNPLEQGIRINPDLAVPANATPIEVAELPRVGNTLLLTNVRDFTADSAQAAVDKCYVDFFDASADKAYGGYSKKDVQDKYGMKEERYSIGFHRAGTESVATKDGVVQYGTDLRDIFVQDHYEYVVLGVKGHNPYRTTSDGRFIAQNLQGDGVHKVELNHVSDRDKVPTFVFDKPIDGAGVLVVNGNLKVADTFAYHGLLVVTGDVIIEPTLKEDSIVYGSDGNPINEAGYSLRKSGGGWALNNGTQYTDPETGELAEVKPLTEDVYRGELIVQGKLVIGGTLKIVEKEAEAGKKVHGELRAYHSIKALEDIGDWGNGQTVLSRVSWTHDDSINVDSIWGDTLDK